MVKINTIKIVCGFKGGVGKTLISSALSVKSIRDNNKTLVVDLNANNPDISDILTNLYNEDFSIHDEYFRWQFPIDDTQKQLVVIRPKFSKWSAGEVWDFIDLVNFKEQHTASNMIVDTHLTLSKLSPNTVYAKLHNLNVETYFIWNPATPDKPTELKEITDAVKEMEELFTFYTSSNQIHIFNPHESKIPRKFFSKGLRKHWRKQMNELNPIAVSVNRMIELIRKLNLEFDYKTELTPSKLFSVWSPFFKQILNLTKGYACINILPIFEHFDLSNFASGQMYSKNRNIRGIQDDMGKFYSYVSLFETMRNKILKK